MRIQWIDTYRGFLAILVIIGHMVLWCTPYDNVDILSVLYISIYTFHMPAFFYAAGRVGRFEEANSKCRNLMDVLKLFINKRSLKRSINLIVPTILSYIILVMTLTIPSILPLKDALIKVNYWFIWVMIIINIIYPICLKILKQKKVVFIVFFMLTIVTAVYSAVLSKFLGYFLCYAAGAYEQDFKSGDRVRGALYHFRYGIILAYFIIVTFFYSKFSIAIVLNPIYKCIFGLFVSFFLAICFSQIKPNKILVEMGKNSFFIYLFQISFFMWTIYKIPKNNFVACCLGFVVTVVVSAFVPLWINKKFKNTIIYKIIFSPYQYIEKYLPSAFTGP